MHKFAKLVSAVLGLPWLILLIYVVFSHADINAVQLWPLLWTSLLFHFVVPIGYLIWAIKTGRISDLDITKREQRYGMLTVTLISYLISLVIIHQIGNTIIFHMFAITIAYITAVYFITFYWKISLHMGVNVLSVLLVNFFYDWKLSILYLAIPLIFWSRYTLKKHTPMQLFLGALLSGSVVIGGLNFFGYI